jgi:two-component sensor histidine kinase
MTDTRLPPDATDEDLRTLLAKQSGLVHEIDHRVKNNLQLISSLLLLQSRRSRNPAVKAALGSTLERVNAVAAVHRRMFQSDDVSQFDLAGFVRELAEDTLGAARRKDIRINLQTGPASVPASMAAPLALVINELVLNAVSHGYPQGRGGVIQIMIEESPSGLRIEVADDGVGMADSQDGGGLGLTVVDLLSQQLRAQVERHSSDAGLRTILHLPLGGAV